MNLNNSTNRQKDIKERISNIELAKTLEINGEKIDIGSDWHLPLDQDCLSAVLQNLRKSQASDIFICLGDIFDTEHGQDSSPRINEILDLIAKDYSLVIFVPGNHDVRGRSKPISSFQLSDSICAPEALKPLVVNTEKNKILVGNIFYDLQFIDPQILDLEKRALQEFYPTLPDGQYLFDGSLSSFPAMTQNLAAALTPEVDILVTHALPHPCLVTFRVENLTAEVQDIAQKQNLDFICDPNADLERSQKWSVTPQEFRDWWNMKSFFMGSNVLEHPQAQPKDGLVCLYGHNHRSASRQITIQSGAKIDLNSYQQPIKT